MQYMLTGVLILIISGLLLNAVSLMIESLYKLMKDMHLKKNIFRCLSRSGKRIDSDRLPTCYSPPPYTRSAIQPLFSVTSSGVTAGHRDDRAG
nr:Uncharacterised protein [Raoultella sp. NCTC 9187]